MRLAKAQIKGFQSFKDSGEIEFLDGINLIIGQNNSGKSALLRALLPTIPNDHHRTPEEWEIARLPTPQTIFTLDVSGASIRDWIILSSTSVQFIPVPQPTQGSININNFLSDFFDKPNIRFILNRVPGRQFSASYPSHRLFTKTSPQQTCVRIHKVDGQLETAGPFRDSETLPQLLYEAWNREMFYFSAERMTIGESAIGYADRLLPNAGNLPQVLHTLNGEKGDIFQKLVDHLREIFPTIGNISVRTKPAGNLFEVLVWPTPERPRVELSFPLNSSGTGVSQTIALLAAIITMDQAVIIIDEINSFLHPAAVKALLRILQTQYSQHQYIISTHSPEVISFSNPSTIHLVTRAGYESHVKRLKLDKVDEFREVAEHLGVSMADVFAADRIIWVEGPTEELCFPHLYQQLVGPIPRGMIISSVAATGDFNAKKRDRHLVYEVYKKLSSAASSLVVSVAFSFDSETLSPQEKAKMQRESEGLLHFLPRRHLECYLVDADAIAALVSRKDPASTTPPTSARVMEALHDEATKQRFHVPQWNNNTLDDNWLTNVDAANLIASVCANLSENRASFSKKEDSLFLLRHIIEHNREQLSPLRDYVKSLVEAVAPN